MNNLRCLRKTRVCEKIIKLFMFNNFYSELTNGYTKPVNCYEYIIDNIIYDPVKTNFLNFKKKVITYIAKKSNFSCWFRKRKIVIPLYIN